MTTEPTHTAIHPGPRASFEPAPLPPSAEEIGGELLAIVVQQGRTIDDKNAVIEHLGRLLGAIDIRLEECVSACNTALAFSGANTRGDMLRDVADALTKLRRSIAGGRP